MPIEHVAIWTNRLEVLKIFYEVNFSARSGQKYTNTATHFESYFLTFGSGARIELMHAPGVTDSGEPAPRTGYAHLAFSVGSREQVDQLTGKLEQDGHQILRQPRMTGDGCYESVILDPDGNPIEITV